MQHLELPIGAFLSAVLVLVPLPWHWRARNVPTLSIIAWLFISNIIYGVNSIIWAGNVSIVAPVWCDIVTKLQMGATMSLPACCLCLCIHLERIASVRQVSTKLSDKRRRMIFDGVMCWGLPVIYMALHYIVQGHRFDIVQDLGCRPTIYNSLQSIFLVWVPPLVAVFLTFIYGGLALYHFFQRRLTFARHLQNSNSALTPSRYFRLMAMAIVQIIWGASLIAFNMWFTCRNGLRPWTGWSDVHFNFSRVGQFPLALFPKSILISTFFNWWSIPISSLIFFIFFAFGQDAVKEYSECLRWILRPFSKRSNKKLDLPFTQPPVMRIALPKRPASTEAISVFETKFTHPCGSRPSTMDRSSSYSSTPCTEVSFLSDTTCISLHETSKTDQIV